MKKSKFTDEQIAFALKQAEVGTPVEEVCGKMGISDATFYNWRKKYGGQRWPHVAGQNFQFLKWTLCGLSRCGKQRRIEVSRIRSFPVKR